MKKILTILTVIAVLGFTTLAVAHGGGFGWSGGHIMGYGGYGGHMMGWWPGYDYSKDTKEYLDKTSDLRRDLHEKRFDYMEALRSGDEEKAEKIANELDEISKTLYRDARKGRYLARGGYGCW